METYRIVIFALQEASGLSSADLVLPYHSLNKEEVIQTFDVATALYLEGGQLIII